jgi:glycosyltransferase involved in cell wall biosynthesis
MHHRLHYERFREHVAFTLDGPGLVVEDFVADVRPAYLQASVVIAPLLASAGTNIKILEAMAMGKAIVSTSAGVNGLDLEPGVDVVVENDPERMATTILQLLDDKEARDRIGRQARATVEARFNWDWIAAEQSAMYRQLIGG